MKPLWRIGSAGLLLVIAACGGRQVQMLGTGGDQVTAEVSVTLTTPLPADAALGVWLVDSTDGATRIAEGTLPIAGRTWPVIVGLRYDDDRIVEDHTYVVRAAITSAGRDVFATQADTLVITRGHTTHPRLVLLPVEAPPPPPSAATNGLAGTSWRLEGLVGAAVVTGADATLDFLDTERVAGSASCNRFSGTVKVSNGAIAFSPLAATRMACADAIMAQEERYLKALGAAERYTLEGGELLIFSKGASSPLRFVRRPMALEMAPAAGG
jgi:heat shock protein HslJ